MRHTIAFSDAHIHDDSRLDYIIALCDYLETRQPPLLVLVGDIGDPWQKKWPDILQTKSWDRLCQLCATRESARLKTIYIRGNHDNGVKTRHLKSLKGVKIRWKYKEGAFLFTHGWEWDPFWGGIGGRIAFWISRNMPCLMIPLYNCWSKRQRSTPRTLKSQGNTDEWSAKTQRIHEMAQIYARKKDLTVVLGHTHYPWMNSFIADAGDWEDSFSFVEITEDGTAALKHLVDGVMKELTMENRVHGEISSMWPKKKTAFLVIHGSGPHRPFEALDSFVRGFRHALMIQDPDMGKEVKWTHKLQRHKGAESWVESLISLALDGGPTVDFYEYYWDCYMVRAVTPREMLVWLDQASDGACTFYRHLPRKAEEYESMGVDLFGDGEFNFRGYRVLIGSFSPIRRRILLLGRCKPLLERVSRYLNNLMGDVVIYTTSDARSANYEIRQKMLNGAVEEMKQLLANDLYQQIVIVGHSLGSVIAYDALSRIVLEMNVNGNPLSEQAQKITGLVTFGSPLDKIAFFFDERTRDESYVQRQTLAQLHGFRRVGPSTDQEPIIIESPIKKNLENLKWLNFYHLKDPVSGSLDAYEVHQNILCTARVKDLSKAHSCYWTWSQMYRDIAHHFFQQNTL